MGKVNVTVGATREDLIDLLATALPYVEDAIGAAHFKPGAPKKHAAAIRAAVEAESPATTTDTTPVETMAWVSTFYRDRAEDDPCEVTKADARQVEAAQTAFLQTLDALRKAVSTLGYIALTMPVGSKRRAELEEENRGFRAAIAAAEGRANG